MVNYEINVLNESADNQSISIELKGDLSISVIRKIKQELASLVHGHQNVELKMHEVEFFDISILQLILALKKMIREQGGRFAPDINLSDEYMDLIELSGFLKLLKNE